MQRPKFCVGEVVDIHSESGVRHLEGYEILSMKYGVYRSVTTGIFSKEWSYAIDNNPSARGLPWSETALRKRRDDNWQNIREIWQPEGETV